MLTDIEKAPANKGYSWQRWVKGRRWLSLSAWCALLVALGCAFEAQAQGQLSRSLERLSTEIVDLFPKVEGDVVKVQGNEAFITLGAPDNIREGMELSVVRKGEEFKHPLTGVALGRFEEDIGVIIINKVSESYSSGNVRLAKANCQPTNWRSRAHHEGENSPGLAATAGRFARLGATRGIARALSLSA